ncbi:LysR substrate-binding domain-containing protein [Chelativorans sp. YIM 93263]|uniref:LysR substrate-binding domain-containing protein n=1 Tax=Chelativorans sp. YIM 93263 TaxID=2906648 RepID=UPI0023798294|nr:LysR substrate-binding domain-containing protein [Chelativorans sp. YIM 93263]
MSELPPLSAVRVFEAAARHLSFTKAAAELGMTQAAVSYQVKVLEDRLGAPLFLRRPRQVILTEVGQRLAPPVTEAFETIREAFATARTGAQGVLSITTVATFATDWLAQRLGSFQVEHPSLAVRLDLSPRLVDFAREEMDVAIRGGNGQWPGVQAHMLMRINFTPMLSPELAASIGGVKEPADLLKLPIIGKDDPWWGQWLTEAGVSPDGLRDQPYNSMGSQTLEGRAAIAGRGVAILTPAFYKSELETGRLIQPFDLVCTDGKAYWLAYPEARRNAPKIAAFRKWLLEEIGKDVPAIDLNSP